MGSKSISGAPQPGLGQQIPNSGPAVMSSGPQSWNAATQGVDQVGLMSRPSPVASKYGGYTGQTVPGMSSDMSQLFDQFKSTGTATPPQAPSTRPAPIASPPAGFNPNVAPQPTPAFGQPAGACPTCGK